MFTRRHCSQTFFWTLLFYLSLAPIAATAIAPTSIELAGAKPIADPQVWQEFHQKEGLERIVTDLGERNRNDPRISELFAGVDRPKLHALLISHFCFILGGGCIYAGRDMTKAHEALDLKDGDFDIFLSNLRASMNDEGVPRGAQAAFIEKFESMRHLMVGASPKN